MVERDAETRFIVKAIVEFRTGPEFHPRTKLGAIAALEHANRRIGGQDDLGANRDIDPETAKCIGRSLTRHRRPNQGPEIVEGLSETIFRTE